METYNGFKFTFREAGVNSYWTAVRETRGARWVYTSKDKNYLIRKCNNFYSSR